LDGSINVETDNERNKLRKKKDISKKNKTIVLEAPTFVL
jgi:hypothetical protein